MSGGWSRNFYMDTAGMVTVRFHYRMIMGQGYEEDEYGEVLLTIDGTKYGSDMNTSVKHVDGDGEDDTGWLYEGEIKASLGSGNHTITVGAYNNNATWPDEYVEVFLDDITVSQL
jgi:hypothetical protein